MAERKTTAQFITDAERVHGKEYDYSLVEYSNNHTKVPILCKLHGVFYKSPQNHLKGQKCPYCNDIVAGFGINDMPNVTDGNGNRLLSYQRWAAMLQRCYDNKYLKNKISYIGCTVCDEWEYFSNFKRWFDENYVEGYHLDKDILVKGNKVYSPETCCFVPQKLNSLLVKATASRGKLPIGVSLTCCGKYEVHVRGLNNKRLYLGHYDNIQIAFDAYKKNKERIIKKYATELWDNGFIKENIYEALMRYEVEITD